MAQKNTKKKTQSSRKSSSKTAENKRPIRREVGAIICLLLGVISVFGYFDNDGWFVNVFCGTIKGLLGYGFYLLPPALLYCFIILMFHRGRPVCSRVICTLLVPVVFGAVVHVFSKSDIELALKPLWTTGKLVTSGGVVSGAIGKLFTYLLGKVCATILLICGLIVFVIVSLRISIPELIKKAKNREHLEYEYVPAETVSKAKSETSTPALQRQARKTINARPEIDIPVDGPGAAERYMGSEIKKASLFNKKSRVKAPDQFYKDGYDSGSASGESSSEDTATYSGYIDTVSVDSGSVTVGPVPLAVDTVEANSEASVAPKTQASQSISKKAVSAADDFASDIKGGKAVDYVFPPVSLLEMSAPPVSGSREEAYLNKERLETTLGSFGINSTISNITRGPAVTRYEMELEPGVKLNKITGLADDIALSLGASGVRIAAIPNKLSTVGIEVPNKLISKVNLREIIDSSAFKNSKSKLTFAIGKDISGNAVIGDISKLPHLLVAGTTGSGKSVCLNSMILSIFYKATPDEVKLIMIDPKMVEFRIYNGVPHLLVPVVTEAKKASGALQWAVREMMKRYRLFSETGARDISSYNKLAEKDETIEKIPQIVVVIDELADLMIIAAKEVEESICRVAQMGRAAGVYLVIATQSPRADVITGLMKANIPSRIALKVSSALESRIILDAGGNADKLVGNGDMLYAPIGTSKPVRIQGTWVSDEEREKIISFIKEAGEAQYSDEVIYEIEKAADTDKDAPVTDNGAPASKNDYDELLPQAVDIVLDLGQASVSMLQRRLKLGYSRAARIVDQMEEMGIVGPFEGSKPRQLLITKQQWKEMQYIEGTAPADRPAEYDEHTILSADDLFDD